MAVIKTCLDYWTYQILKKYIETSKYCINEKFLSIHFGNGMDNKRISNDDDVMPSLPDSCSAQSIQCSGGAGVVYRSAARAQHIIARTAHIHVNCADTT